jgi:hypothetical protein
VLGLQFLDLLQVYATTLPWSRFRSTRSSRCLTNGINENEFSTLLGSRILYQLDEKRHPLDRAVLLVFSVEKLSTIHTVLLRSAVLSRLPVGLHTRCHTQNQGLALNLLGSRLTKTHQKVEEYRASGVISSPIDEHTYQKEKAVLASTINAEDYSLR